MLNWDNLYKWGAIAKTNTTYPMEHLKWSHQKLGQQRANKTTTITTTYIVLLSESYKDKYNNTNMNEHPINDN